MTVAVGIDIGASAMPWRYGREGRRRRSRQGLKIAANRGGFDDLDAWRGGSRSGGSGGHGVQRPLLVQPGQH